MKEMKWEWSVSPKSEQTPKINYEPTSFFLKKKCTYTTHELNPSRAVSTHKLAKRVGILG